MNQEEEDATMYRPDDPRHGLTPEQVRAMDEAIRVVNAQLLDWLVDAGFAGLEVDDDEEDAVKSLLKHRG